MSTLESTGWFEPDPAAVGVQPIDHVFSIHQTQVNPLIK
jgi:hypothetical protein